MKLVLTELNNALIELKSLTDNYDKGDSADIDYKFNRFDYYYTLFFQDDSSIKKYKFYYTWRLRILGFKKGEPIEHYDILLKKHPEHLRRNIQTFCGFAKAEIERIEKVDYYAEQFRKTDDEELINYGRQLEKTETKGYLKTMLEVITGLKTICDIGKKATPLIKEALEYFNTLF